MTGGRMRVGPIQVCCTSRSCGAADRVLPGGLSHRTLVSYIER